MPTINNLIVMFIGSLVTLTLLCLILFLILKFRIELARLFDGSRRRNLPPDVFRRAQWNGGRQILVAEDTISRYRCTNRYDIILLETEADFAGSLRKHLSNSIDQLMDRSDQVEYRRKQSSFDV